MFINFHYGWVSFSKVFLCFILEQPKIWCCLIVPKKALWKNFHTYTHIHTNMENSENNRRKFDWMNKFVDDLWCSLHERIFWSPKKLHYFSCEKLNVCKYVLVNKKRKFSLIIFIRKNGVEMEVVHFTLSLVF